MNIITNIGELCGIVPKGVLRKQGSEMDELVTLKDAFLTVRDGRIAGFGSMKDCPVPGMDDEVTDACGGMVMPAFCDSHTHICYAGTREREFIDKIHGLSYEEIAARGGGILNSADLLHSTGEDELFRQTMARVDEMIAKGTGAIEIKSGYGLTVEDELKMLRVIRRIKEGSPATIKATFLGAHAVGRAYSGRQEEYVDLVCKEMVPAVGEGKLADFIDVFCDEGFFTPAQTERIILAGQEYGLRAKIHANELAVSGGVQACPQTIWNGRLRLRSKRSGELSLCLRCSRDHPSSSAYRTDARRISSMPDWASPSPRTTILALPLPGICASSWRWGASR